jgi:hypothetical protein
MVYYIHVYIFPVVSAVNNKPYHSTDYWEDVHMYLINHATALTTGKMLLRGLIINHATALTTGKMLLRGLIINHATTLTTGKMLLRGLIINHATALTTGKMYTCI